MKTYKLIWLNVNEVYPYENNPRININAIEPVAKSLELYDWTKPIAIDTDHVIICGHTRLLAAIYAGRDKVLCRIVDDLTPEQIKAYRIADNKLAEIATWNYADLIPELEYLQSTGIDVSLLGLDIIDTSAVELEVKDGEIGDNENPEEDDTVYSQQGTVYKLGDHILVCGDNQTKECYKALMDEDKANLYICDTVKDFDDDNFLIHAMNSFALAKECCTDNSNFYYFFDSKTSLSAHLACKQSNVTIKTLLYWLKNKIGKDGYDYHNKHENIIFGNLYVDSLFQNNDKNTNIFKYKKTKSEKRCKGNKPVELIMDFIESCTKRGDIVLDNWGGTGTTLIACEKIGRRCRIIENNEACCDLIRKRYAEFQFGEGCDWEELTPSIGVVDYE